MVRDHARTRHDAPDELQKRLVLFSPQATWPSPSCVWPGKPASAPPGATTRARWGAYVYREAWINQPAATTKMSATTTRATAPAPMSIAAKVSIMPPIGVISICLQSSPPVGLTPGTLASPGGAKVLLIGGLQTPDRPQSYPYRAAHQAGRPSRGAATICLICMPARASRADSSRAELAIWPVQRRKPIAEPILVCCVRAHETLNAL